MKYPNDQALAFGVIKDINASCIVPKDIDVVAKCKFVGIYLRCRGNSSWIRVFRFDGELSNELWYKLNN